MPHEKWNIVRITIGSELRETWQLTWYRFQLLASIHTWACRLTDSREVTLHFSLSHTYMHTRRIHPSHLTKELKQNSSLPVEVSALCLAELCRKRMESTATDLTCLNAWPRWEHTGCAGCWAQHCGCVSLRETGRVTDGGRRTLAHNIFLSY